MSNNLNSQEHYIVFKKGVLANINSVATKNSAIEGEPHWTTDTNQLFVFDGTDNVQINNWERDAVNGYLYPATLTDNVGIGTASPGYPLHISYDSTGVSDPGLVVESSTGQSSVQFQVAGVEKGRWRVDSSGNQVISAADSGRIYFMTGISTTEVIIGSDGASFGSADTSPEAQVEIQPKVATRKALIVQGYASQSANLQEWQDSSENILASISSGGAISLPITTQTTTTLTLGTTHHTVLCDCTSNTVTITLPTAVGITGRIYNIKCINDTYACSVDGTASETIDGSTDAITLINMETITVQSDGANWWII